MPDIQTCRARRQSAISLAVRRERTRGFRAVAFRIILDRGLKFQVSGFEFSESMDDGSMLAHLEREGRDDHNPLIFVARNFEPET